jgi:hypothetical protein
MLTLQEIKSFYNDVFTFNLFTNQVSNIAYLFPLSNFSLFLNKYFFISCRKKVTVTVPKGQ